MTYYWTAERATAEVDFVINNGIDVIPIEVKAETKDLAQNELVFSYSERDGGVQNTSLS